MTLVYEELPIKTLYLHRYKVVLLLVTSPFFNSFVWELMEWKLYKKFRKERKNIDDDPDVMQRERQKSMNKDKGTSKPASSKLKRGAIKWEPCYPEEEDEVSFKRHKAWLGKYSNRTRITISDRRRFMYASPAIGDAKKEYPTLKFENLN